MLTRRNLFKSAATFGLSAFAPWLDRSVRGAVPEARYGPEPASNDSRLGRESCLLELECLENLKDDLDCVEVVARCGLLLKRPRWTGAEPMRGISYCPFCGEVGFQVGLESFRCKWCEADGSAIEFYARAEGLPQGEAASRLDALLRGGVLDGRRPENEHACRMLEEAQRFYHELLCEKPEGWVARQCLAEQGLTQSTIKRFRLGYSPPEPDDCLSRQLVAAGYAIPKLLQTAYVNADGEQKLIDRYGGGNLLIPVCDSAGRSWGFMKKNLLPRPNSMQAGWTQDTLSVSERRLRRLIFPHPLWPQDFNRHKVLLVAETPWEVVALHNAGIENVVYLFDYATDPVRLRTLLSYGQDFLCSFDPKGYRPVTAFHFTEKLAREARQLSVMSVPSKGGLLGILQSTGVQAVRDAMSHAIPFHQWLRA